MPKLHNVHMEPKGGLVSVGTGPGSESLGAEGREIVRHLDALLVLRLQDLSKDLTDVFRHELIKAKLTEELFGAGGPMIDLPPQFVCAPAPAEIDCVEQPMLEHSAEQEATRPRDSMTSMMSRLTRAVTLGEERMQEADVADHNDKERQRHSEAMRVADAKKQQVAERQAVEMLSFRPPTWVQVLVGSAGFEVASTVIIILNSIMLGIEIQYAAMTMKHGRKTPIAFLVIRVVFSSVFLLELLLRIWAAGSKFIKTKDWKWNVFDVLLVVVSLPELASDAMTLSGLNGSSSVNISQLRLLRMMKVLRLVRLVRSPTLVRIMRPLQIMLVSIVHTLRALAWILVLQGLIMYTFGCIIVQAMLENVGEFGLESVQNGNQDLFLFWGHLGDAVLTLFMAVTGGISWHEAIRPLEHLDFWLVYVFCIYIFFIYFCVANVVTGVFCNSAIEAASTDPDLQVHYITQKKMRLGDQMKDFFGRMDQNSSGTVTVAEFQEALSDPHMCAYFEALGMGIGEAWELFKLLDRDNSNAVETEEFVQGCIRLKGGSSTVDMALVRQDIEKLIWILETNLVNPVKERVQLEHNRRKFVATALAEAEDTMPGKIRGCRVSEDEGLAP
eukprot:TRINITY_DN48342_c0_g1_i1.p1 TRINITY_DN48342_c0_g1~~TRINITY_DN48342_c0_g1_i1.p1  ORF type:complete len:622 (+),score=119.50 TRINITY_DN48342_c0_g1_i1:29-1867(+)